MVTIQERSHAGNHIVVVVMIVQVYLLLGCGSMVNDSVEMLSIIQIQNKDDMCCARAIVTAKAKIDGHEQWNSIQRGRRIQEELALELHTKAGVPLHQCGIDDVQTFQRFRIQSSSV
jgi:hypothetical protein